MPEAAIGFVADVGGNSILAKAPLHRALLFEMSGVTVVGADALALGLADCSVPAERLAAVRAGVINAANAGSVETTLVNLMQSEAVQAGDRDFCVLADQLDDEMLSEGAEAIVAAVAAAVEDVPAAAGIAKTLASRSPTSLEAIWQGHMMARRLPDIGEVLAMELRLARFMASQPDFVEGVRAVLVDKDQKPRWMPADLAAVPRDAISAAVAQPKAS